MLLHITGWADRASIARFRGWTNRQVQTISSRAFQITPMPPPLSLIRSCAAPSICRAGAGRSPLTGPLTGCPRPGAEPLTPEIGLPSAAPVAAVIANPLTT